MKKQLKNIASIQSWFYLRSDNSWDVVYLQAKLFDTFWDIKETLIPDIRHENIQDRYLLQDWDILFSAKWTRNFATVYKKEYWPCIASSTFFIIRLKDMHIIPEYIVIIINESQKTNYFKNNLSWWTIQSIPKPALEDFEIFIPPIERQKQIINLHKLYKQELQIYEKLKSRKEELINKIILNSNISKHE